MTVPSEVSRVQYTTDGVSVTFPVPFRFIDEHHLRVTIERDGDSRTLVLGSEYTTAGANSPAGGTVTTKQTFTSGGVLTIERIVPITQETAYQRNDPFPERAHEQALDKLTMIAQMLGSVLGLTPGSVNRALLLGAGDVDGRGAYRANGNRIRDVGAPTQATDAARWQDVIKALADLSTDGTGQFVVERLADTSDPGNGAGMVAGAANLNATLNKFIDGQLRIGSLVPQTTPGARDTVLLARDIQGLSDRHGFRDESILSNISDYGGYGTFDAVVKFTGVNMFDHQFSFQDRFRYDGLGSGGLGTAGGFLSRQRLDGGTVQRRHAIQVEDYQGDAEVLVQQAINIKALSKGNVNYSLVSEGRYTIMTHAGRAGFGFPLVASGVSEGLVYGGYSTETATQIGVNSRGGGNPDALVSYAAVRAAPGMMASDESYTIPDLFGVDVANGGKGSNSNASRFTGVNVRALSNATSNRAYVSLVNSAADNWALFFHNGAQSYHSGNLGIGTSNDAMRPPARLYIDPSTATVPQLQLRQGGLTTTPMHGALEFDGTDLWFTVSGVRRKILFDAP